ncbi:MAG: fumarate reductase subunit C, partial [Chloroflexota bacterium]
MTGKQYVRPVPSTWWLAKKSYTLFMFREATA